MDAVVGIDARGFIFAAAAATKLKAGFVPVRKKGKLPFQTIEQDYALEYGHATVAMHIDALKPGARVLLIDDLLATGGTSAAAVALMQKLGAKILETSFLIELKFLNGREKLKRSSGALDRGLLSRAIQFSTPPFPLHCRRCTGCKHSTRTCSCLLTARWSIRSSTGSCRC